jgi:hypothetical protein
MGILDKFELKEFDLEPIFAKWENPPRFEGVPSRDPPVDEWLKAIKIGCEQRGVPHEYWHKVGQHYLGERARRRLADLKTVLRNLHGGRYRFDWKRFKVAMQNMGCMFRSCNPNWSTHTNLI